MIDLFDACRARRRNNPAGITTAGIPRVDLHGFTRRRKDERRATTLGIDPINLQTPFGKILRTGDRGRSPKSRNHQQAQAQRKFHFE